MVSSEKHPVEDQESWSLHLDRLNDASAEYDANVPLTQRRLKHHHKHKKSDEKLELQKEKEFAEQQEKADHKAKKERKKLKKERLKRFEGLYSHPGIQQDTVHGMVIDAGSSGSRLHLFEWEPRVLRDAEDVEAAVSGRKLSYPGSTSRWTERLSPGISTFSTIQNDDELETAIAEYLQPLLDFAKTILHEKQHDFHNFRIYVRATAGMRILQAEDRSRVMRVVRKLFGNETYCPFYFEPEQARTLSGEEEAIYDWLGANFLLSNGEMLNESEGSGTVTSPRKTYGALDLGGASTQIAFYEQNEDIMANLFKLQIGQGKHWNVYTHSFLFYGINEATNRFEARLSYAENAEDRLLKGVYNPCLPGGSSRHIRTDIHVNEHGMETWDFDPNSHLENGSYQAVIKNDKKRGDFDACNSKVQELLHVEQNAWCNFDHKGDCSFAGAYQPKLPEQSDQFGEFLAFSNYVRVWDFLDLPERASIAQLENATRRACSLSKKETFKFNNKRVDDDTVEQYCFRSVYAMNLLKGFGFHDEDFITAKKVINGHKVGWPVGAMLYEINALPWEYERPNSRPALSFDNVQYEDKGFNWVKLEIGAVALLVLFAGILYRQRHHMTQKMVEYEPVKDVEQEEVA